MYGKECVNQVAFYDINAADECNENKSTAFSVCREVHVTPAGDTQMWCMGKVYCVCNIIFYEWYKQCLITVPPSSAGQCGTADTHCTLSHSVPRKAHSINSHFWIMAGIHPSIQGRDGAWSLCKAREHTEQDVSKAWKYPVKFEEGTLSTEGKFVQLQSKDTSKCCRHLQWQANIIHRGSF